MIEYINRDDVNTIRTRSGYTFRIPLAFKRKFYNEQKKQINRDFICETRGNWSVDAKTAREYSVKLKQLGEMNDAVIAKLKKRFKYV